MTKRIGYSVLIGLSMLVLSACQSVKLVDIHRITPEVAKNSLQNSVSIYCSGTEYCNFARLNDLDLIDASSQHVNRKAFRLGYVKPQGKNQGHQDTYLTIPPQQSELVIRFYRSFKEDPEIFHVIHDFKKDQEYTFRMYRYRSPTSGSLLNVSTPAPICVAMLQKNKIIRRFCRPHDALKGVGEFTEKKV